MIIWKMTSMDQTGYYTNNSRSCNNMPIYNQSRVLKLNWTSLVHVMESPHLSAYCFNEKMIKTLNLLNKKWTNKVKQDHRTNKSGM